MFSKNKNLEVFVWFQILFLIPACDNGRASLQRRRGRGASRSRRFRQEHLWHGWGCRTWPIAAQTRLATADELLSWPQVSRCWLIPLHRGHLRWTYTRMRHFQALQRRSWRRELPTSCYRAFWWYWYSQDMHCRQQHDDNWLRLVSLPTLTVISPANSRIRDSSNYNYKFIIMNNVKK